MLVTPVCVSVCLSLAAFPHYCTDPDITWRNGRGCPLVVHYWADLQSVHGFRCCDNVSRERNVSECLFLLYAWLRVVARGRIKKTGTWTVTQRNKGTQYTHTYIQYIHTHTYKYTSGIERCSFIFFAVSFIHHSFMATLWNKACHYIFVLWFLLSSFFLAILSRRSLDVYHTCTHDVALVRILDAGLKRAARDSLKIQDA